MLGSINDLLKFTLHAAGGGIGTIVNAYFDDAHSTVRYLVVSTGTWLSGRRVLVSPASVNHLDWFGHIISVGLTREQVEMQPGCYHGQACFETAQGGLSHLLWLAAVLEYRRVWV